MSWSSQRRKQGIFCTAYFVWRKFFWHLCFTSLYSILNTLSEYTYFYILRNITLYTFLLAFKIVKSLQCIFKYKIRWCFISGISNHLLLRNFPLKILATYAVKNVLQLKPSSCFWTSRNVSVSFPRVVSWKFWCSAFKSSP